MRVFRTSQPPTQSGPRDLVPDCLGLQPQRRSRAACRASRGQRRKPVQAVLATDTERGQPALAGSIIGESPGTVRLTRRSGVKLKFHGRCPPASLCS